MPINQAQKPDSGTYGFHFTYLGTLERGLIELMTLDDCNCLELPLQAPQCVPSI